MSCTHRYVIFTVTIINSYLFINGLYDIETVSCSFALQFPLDDPVKDTRHLLFANKVREY